MSIASDVAKEKLEAEKVSNGTAVQNSSDSKSELEEMTIAEIDQEIPEELLGLQPWNPTDKINVRLHNGDTVLHYALQRYKKMDDELSTFIIKIIQTGHRKDKRGCDINAADSFGYPPLQRIFITKENYPNIDILKNIELILALISAGAKVNSFDISAEPKKYFEPGESGTKWFLTAIDVLMRTYHYDDVNRSSASIIDGYSLSNWNPSKPVPETFKTPVVRYLLKTIFERTEFVSDFIYFTPSELLRFMNEFSGIFPNVLNALICDYAAPLITDVRSLSCFKRDTQFFISLLYIGKQFFEADVKLAAESQSENSQKGLTNAAANPSKTLTFAFSASASSNNHLGSNPAAPTVATAASPFQPPK